jgi:hypothetical protein
LLSPSSNIWTVARRTTSAWPATKPHRLAAWTPALLTARKKSSDLVSWPGRGHRLPDQESEEDASPKSTLGSGLAWPLRRKTGGLEHIGIPIWAARSERWWGLGTDWFEWKTKGRE